MALSSYFSQIRDAVTDYIAPYTRTETLLNKHIRRVLESEMPTYRASQYRAVTREWSFRAIDADQFRLLTNVELDDDLSVAEGEATGLIETAGLDISGGQLAMGVVTKDDNAGGAVSFDLCLDASPDDLTTGSFLHADESVALAFGTEIYLDVYPSEYLVVRLNVTSPVRVRSLRMKLLFVGSRDVLSEHLDAIARFAAIRILMEERQKYAVSGALESARNLWSQMQDYKNLALGVLGVKEGKGDRGGALGGPIDAGVPVENSGWSRAAGRE